MSEIIGEKGVCKLFPDLVRKVCGNLIDIYGAKLIDYIRKGYNSDVICDKLNFCDGY